MSQILLNKGLSKTFVTSDTHFGHDKIRKYSNRPFDNIEEMDIFLSDNINREVGPQDVLWILGDFSFYHSKRYRDLINCKNVHLVYGNHDYKRLKELQPLFTTCQDVKVLKVDGWEFFLSHYAHWVWPKKHYNTIHCFGHSHGKVDAELDWISPRRLSLDVGVDSISKVLYNKGDIQALIQELYQPVSLQWIIDHLAKKTGFASDFGLHNVKTTDITTDEDYIEPNNCIPL